MFGVYAILNEKVPWLCTYQSFSLELFAALLLGHWLATHPNQPGPVVGRIMDFWDSPAVEAGAAAHLALRAAFRILCLGAFVFLILFTAGQHLRQVFFKPDYPSELLVYTATTDEFADEIRKIQRLQKDSGQRLKVAVDGKSEWPCAWYFRDPKHFDVRWKGVDLSRDVQILDDTSENRRRMQPRTGKTWNLEPCHLRGWWIWNGTPNALPGKLEFWPNIMAFLRNALNDHTADFPKESRPKAEDYAVGFRNQVLGYAFFRKIWYPTGGENTLVCFRTDQEVPASVSQSSLAGSESAPQPVSAIATLGVKGAGPGQFNEPRGLTVTPEGNLAIADSKNGRIEVLSPTGEFRFEFGKGILSPEYSGPSDVACDAEGSFYIADTWNHAIRKFSSKGELLKTVTAWERQGDASTGFFGPRGVAVSAQGEVAIADTGHKFVRVFDRDLKAIVAWGGPGSEPGQFNEPVGIAYDPSGRIYVADTGNGRIQRFSGRGEFDKEWLTFRPLENEVVGMEPHLEVLPDGRLVTTASTIGTVWVIDPEKMAAKVLRISSPRFLQPLGIASDGAGGFWVSSRSGSAVGRVRIP
jgi:DNA-binding beta-propeller fold protein YncE